MLTNSRAQYYLCQPITGYKIIAHRQPKCRSAVALENKDDLQKNDDNLKNNFKIKTTSKKLQNEDDLKKMKNKDDLKKRQPQKSNNLN